MYHLRRTLQLFVLLITALFIYAIDVGAALGDDPAVGSELTYFCSLNKEGVEASKLPFKTRTRNSRVLKLESVPTVNLLSPLDGANLNVRDIIVEFETIDHIVGPLGTPHIHFHLDNEPIPYMMFNGDDPMQFGQQAVLFDFDLTSRATWLSPTSLRFNALSNGSHTLTVYLVDEHHNQLGNSEATQTITFNVYVPPDDQNMPLGIVFVKEEINPAGMGFVTENDHPTVGDLYMLTPPTSGGTLIQLTDVAADGGGVTDPEVSWDGKNILFSMRQSAEDTWHIWELKIQSGELQQITFDPPFLKINDIDPAYLPDGSIIFASDRNQNRDEYGFGVPTQFYTIDADGGNMRLIEPQHSHNLNPQALPDGRVLFDRWDNRGIFRNNTSNWFTNQDGTASFVFYGGASPRAEEQISDVQGLESRQLVDGQMVGIFTNRRALGEGLMGIYDNRNGDLEDLPRPIIIGPAGYYRTPHTLTTYELVYSYSEATQEQFGLYTMPWTPENVLVDDLTESTAPGPGTDPAYRTYEISLSEPGRVYIEVTGSADDNGKDDKLWLNVNGVDYNTKLERKLDGGLIQSLVDTFRLDLDLDAGLHTIHVATDETPTLLRVRIVEASRGGTPTLLYDDPATNEISPIPVRSRTVPSPYPSHLNYDLSWGTFLVRDVSLRGDFRQPNYDSVYGDPNFNFHLDLNLISGLRIYQSYPRQIGGGLLAGETLFDPTRVLGVSPANEYGAASFQVQAVTSTSWDLIDLDGGAIVHEHTWNTVQPGELRACGGCHVPQMPYVQRESGPFSEPTDLRTRGAIYTFVDQVLPIVQNECTACHTGVSPAGGLDLTGARLSFDQLRATVTGRVPETYVVPGDAVKSFVFQLVTGDARGDSVHQARIDAINSGTNHEGMLDSAALYELATWLDVGAGFAFLDKGDPIDPPRVVGVFPRPGTATAARNTSISLLFNEPMDRATVNGSTFILREAGGSVVPGELVWGNNKTVTFKPDNLLTAGEYEITLSGDVRGIQLFGLGQPLVAPFSSTFQVGGGIDSTPPSIVETVPNGPEAPIGCYPNYSGCLSSLGPLVARFNEPIDPGTVSEFNLWVETANGYFLEGWVNVSPDGHEAGFTPRNLLQPGAGYNLFVGEGIRDLAGNLLPALPSSIVVSVPFTVSNTAHVQEYSLAAEPETDAEPEALAINSNGTQVLVANRGDNTISLFDAVNWMLLNTFTVGEGPHDVAFSLDGSLAFVLTYWDDTVKVVRLSDGAILSTTSGFLALESLALSDDGDSLFVTDLGNEVIPDTLYELDVNPVSATFGQILRSMQFDDTPSSVVVPRGNQLGAGEVIYVGLGRDLLAIDTNLWIVRQKAKLTSSAISELALSPDGRTAFVPVINVDSLDVVDLITAERRVTIPLDSDPDDAVLSVEGRFVYLMLPEQNEVAVLDISILQFTNSVPGGGVQLEGLGVLPNGNVMVLNHNDPGNLRVYKPIDATDTTPPDVIGVVPGAGTVNVPNSTPVFITFSEAVDLLSVTDQTVYLETGGNKVPTAYHFSVDGRGVTLVPAGLLAPGASYAVHITTGLKDLAGNTLNQEMISSFNTAAVPAAPTMALWAQPAAGENPRGVAITPDGNTLLAADYFATDVTLFNTSDWSRTVLDLEQRSAQMAVSPDGSRAYVLRPEVDDVAVIDLASKTVIDMAPGQAGLQGIPVGDTPDNLLHHPTDPRVYVINQLSGDVSVINTQTNQEIARWPLNGVGPEDSRAHGAAFSPDLQRLYVTSRYAISVLDIHNGNLIARYDNLPGNDQYGIVVVDGGNQVWFTSSTNELIGFDLRTEQIVAAMPMDAEPTWLELSPDGETILVLHKTAGNVTLVNWRTATEQASYPLPPQSFDLALSADGERFYVGNSEANNVTVVQFGNPNDLTAPKAQAVLPALGTPRVNIHTPIMIEFDEALDRNTVHAASVQLLEGLSPAATAAAMTVTLSAGNQTVYLYPDPTWKLDTVYSLHFDGLADMSGNLITDAPFSYFSTFPVLEPVTMTKSSDPLDDLPTWGLAISPNGKLVAVSNYEEGNISLVDARSIAVIGGPITTGNGPYGLTFNQDGSLLYVAQETDGALVEVDVATQQVLRTITGLPGAQEVTLSSDGSKAYVTGYNSGGVHLVDLPGGQVTPGWLPLTNTGRAAIAADGTLYVPARDELWRLNPDDTWSVLALPGSGYLFDIVFSGDGRYGFLSQVEKNKIEVVDISLWQSIAMIDVGKQPRQLAASPDGRLLAVGNAKDATLQILDMVTFNSEAVLPVDGWYLSVLGWEGAPSGDEGGLLFTGNSFNGLFRRVNVLVGPPEPPPTVNDVLYLSSTTGGSVNGLTFADEDVLVYDGRSGIWYMVFDGSDVGLGSTDIDAFTIMDDGSLLISLDNTLSVAGVGEVDDSDIIRFVPGSLGLSTTGVFEMYFDGSDVDLTETTEDIDALTLAPDGSLIISTLGDTSVNGTALNATDEDLLLFNATSLGQDTAGTWSVYFNGSDVGLADSDLEDVQGAWVDPTSGRIYLATAGIFDVPDSSGDGADVFVCAPSQIGSITACSYGPGLYFDGSMLGFGSENVDGLSLRPGNLPAGQVWTSSTTGGSIGGVNMKDEDIIGYDESLHTWYMVLDGSDVGIGNTDINSFAQLEDGSFLISLDSTSFNIPGLGLVEDVDVLKFTPTQLGLATSGAFELYFDGSDVELTAAQEDIDAIAIAADGSLIISTMNNAVVAGGSIVAADEDLLLFTATSLGDVTTGFWSIFLDGSDGLLDNDNNEDIVGIWQDHETGILYLTTQGVFSVPGVGGDGADIFTCTAGWLGVDTSCVFGPGLFFDGSTLGLAGELVDGITLFR